MKYVNIFIDKSEYLQSGRVGALLQLQDVTVSRIAFAEAFDRFVHLLNREHLHVSTESISAGNLQHFFDLIGTTDQRATDLGTSI